jgi:small-conductance mechanosensitive channel
MLAVLIARIADFLASYERPIVTLLVLLILLVTYRLATRALRRYMETKAHKEENIQNFLLLWRYAWLGIAAILIIATFSGSIAALGLSAAFLGIVIGWSLQAPVTGLAAWLMIILKRPFKIGDRIIVSGIIGDVIDINLTHVVLNQVGGTVGGEEKSGRGVLVPNATLFQQVIYNYAFESNYILDEVVVNITYESDLDEAQAICLRAAREVTDEIVKETGQEPFTRVELIDWGLRLRLRYQTMATDRQRISSEIVQIVFREFAGNDRVEFCYPHTEILHRPKDQTGMPQAAPGS